MHSKSLAELSQALQQKKLSSVELTRYFLGRIEQYDSQLNSFITVTPELALTQAQAAVQEELDRYFERLGGEQTK